MSGAELFLPSLACGGGAGGEGGYRVALVTLSPALSHEWEREQSVRP